MTPNFARIGDYTCTARDNELVHYNPKSLDEMSWRTLPLQRLLVHANAVLSLPSDKKFVIFSHISLDSPSISTFVTCTTQGVPIY